MNMLSIRTFAAAAVASVAILGSTNAFAAAEDRWFNLTNESEWAIEGVYVANLDKPTWGPNLLRGDAIEPADYAELDPVGTDGSCEFDILIEFEDGYELELPEVDLCTYIDIYTDGSDYDLVAI